MPAFYLCDEQQAGFRYDGSSWTQFGSPLTGWVPVAATVSGSPLLVYVLPSITTDLFISNDGGATWTQRALPTGLTGGIFSLWARVPGEVYLLGGRGSPTVGGIWRTVDDGVSWTRIIPFTTTISIGGKMALGTEKLFYAQPTIRNTTTNTDTWVFNRANLDGTSIETWATQDFAEADGVRPAQFLLRAISDDFVLAVNFRRRLCWKIDAGGITSVLPTAIPRPWDLLPLTATQWLAVGQASTGTTVRVYRTDDAGGTWTSMTTIASAEGFALNGAPDSYYMLYAPRPSVPNEVVMLGNASSSVQQIVWVSSDAGSTWTSMVNAAEPYDAIDDIWTLEGPGSVAVVSPEAVTPVAIPSRLATIVG